MARGRTRIDELTPPRGFWLALFAATIQVLLPFLVALDLALVSDPAYAGRAVFVCSAERTASQTEPGGKGHQTHRGVSAACPLCAAFAAGQGFVAADTPNVPLPQSAALPPPRSLARTPLPTAAHAAYDSRGPPPIA